MEAELWQKADLQQEADIWQYFELRWPKFETTEEREGSRTGASEEEEAWDEDDKDDSDEGITTYREDIYRPDEAAERGNYVSDGDEDVNQDNVQGGGDSEADECQSGRSNGD